MGLLLGEPLFFPPTTQSRVASTATGASRMISNADRLGLLLSCPHGRPGAKSGLVANQMCGWLVVSAKVVVQMEYGHALRQICPCAPGRAHDGALRAT